LKKSVFSIAIRLPEALLNSSGPEFELTIRNKRLEQKELIRVVLPNRKPAKASYRSWLHAEFTFSDSVLTTIIAVLFGLTWY